MSPLKHRRRLSLFAVIALAFSVAALSSCGRSNPTAQDAEDAGKKKETGPSAADLDRALGEAAAEALGDREGAVLVMDPRTGRVRAVVNPRLAFEQAFPPGSTIKAFTALTAMRAGLIDRESRILCPGRFTGDGLDIVCSHPKSKAPFTLAQALGYSCNYMFAKLSGRLSFDAFKATLAGAGLGAKTGINAGGESAGSLRDGDWQVRNLLGEGDNLQVTPIQLLTAYCALMNGGHLFRPRAADAENFVSDERTNLHIEEPQRAALIEGMRGAVVYGTAERAGLSSLPIFVFGKTGTSTSSNGFRRQGWFVSFAANASGAADATPESLELAVLVFIKRSHGSDAAVVSHRVFEEYLKRKTGEGRGREGGGETARGGETQTIRVKILSENRIATIPVEEYVLGVLSIEAAVEDEIEALKAQAIVSRTYAIKNAGRHAGEGFDLCSNTHCQQYANADSRASDTMRRAVVETAGSVLNDASGQTADAYFHAACGGHTANFQSLWATPGPGYLRGVRDDYCSTMPNHEWTDEIPAARLASALASDPLTDAGRKIDDIIVTRRDGTGRAEIISIEGERRRQVRGWPFKLIVGRELGWNVLKSSRFSVTRKGAVFIFRGSGFGHGLGLCQNGAHVMARRGGTFEQILNKYFPGVRVSREQAHAGARERKAAGIQWEPQPVFANEAGPQTFRRCSVGLMPHQFLSSEHFRVIYPAKVSRSEIESAIRTLEAARRDIAARAGSAALSLSDAALDVRFHETTQGFVAATGQPWWVAGVTRDRRIEMQPLAVLRRRRILSSTLRHEYAHAVIEAGAGREVPRWLAEGLAINFAGEGPMLLRFASKSRLPLDELERRLARPGTPAEMRSLYAAAYDRVRTLIRTEGEASVWRRIGARSAHLFGFFASLRSLASLRETGRLLFLDQEGPVSRKAAKAQRNRRGTSKIRSYRSNGRIEAAMLIKKPEDIKSSEITGKELYLNRRLFLRGAVLAGGAVATGYVYRYFTSHDGEVQSGEKIADVQAPVQTAPPINEPSTSYEDITHYNNFYEFSTDKLEVAVKARRFVSRPWTVAVEGLVQKPRVFDIDDLLKISPPEERIYRHRCVERWSMVVPWVGFPLAKLLDEVQPLSQAKYIAFETLADPKQMPNLDDEVLEWPYVEGLRLDEAMHPLTILASGLYGETLPPQNGAPLRLVVPWKYGFKGAKSIVRIKLVDSEPPTAWNLAGPREYGFYSNVNPNRDHPRWSQKQERRIGEFGLRDTLMFNGYGDQVAQLYSGMDLIRHY